MDHFNKRCRNTKSGRSKKNKQTKMPMPWLQIFPHKYMFTCISMQLRGIKQSKATQQHQLRWLTFSSFQRKSELPRWDSNQRHCFSRPVLLPVHVTLLEHCWRTSGYNLICTSCQKYMYTKFYTHLLQIH